MLLEGPYCQVQIDTPCDFLPFEQKPLMQS